MPTTGAYHGSCHCGNIKYQVRLTFPPIHDPSATSIRLYRCNCNTCHKMGLFHCKPIDFSEDFILMSPSTIEELADYQCNSEKIGWYFCKNCGVRTFGLGGSWEQVELDVEKWAGKTDSEGKLQKVWKTKGGEIEEEVDGKKTTRPYHYLSVNAVTLEAGQEDVDLRKWHEDGWLFYVDCRESMKRDMRLGEPFFGGMY